MEMNKKNEIMKNKITKKYIVMLNDEKRRLDIIEVEVNKHTPPEVLEEKLMKKYLMVSEMKE